MRRLTILLSAAVFALGTLGASAQDKYPNRPIKVLVPYAPGGATDITARIIADEIQKITGQGFVVINKPGAFGMLAIDEMVKAAPDGYTLMIGNVTTNAITPMVYSKKMSFNYWDTVIPITRLADYPNVPTMAEVGYAGIGTQQWQALFARAGTPKPILDALFKAASGAVKSPQAEKIFAPQYIRALPSESPQEAARWLNQDTEAWRKIIATADLKLE